MTLLPRTTTVEGLNQANIERLVNFLQALPPEKFVMRHFAGYINIFQAETAQLPLGHYHPCNTSACLCGWINLIRLTEDEGTAETAVTFKDMEDTYEAARWLGVGQGDIGPLFTQQWGASNTQAVSMLKELAKTGKVNWPSRYNNAEH